MDEKRLTRRFHATKRKFEKREKAIKQKKRSSLTYTARAKSFKKIVKLFFAPIINNESLAELDFKNKLELLFSANLRQIITFTCVKTFNIPGFVPHQERSETVRFNIRPGDLLWIRIDVRTPDMIDVESLKNNCVYRLTSQQYAYILSYIERLTPICKTEMDK